MSVRFTPGPLRGTRPALAVLCAVAIIAATAATHAQGRGGRGGPAAPAGPPRQTAPVDLTGTWVSVITEDWRVRMLTPQKQANGQADVGSIPANQAARQAANQWDPSREGACEAYGVGNLMRMPVRLKISWQDDFTLKIESDAGQQTRLLRFNQPGQQAINTSQQPRTLQGVSIAEWQRSGGALDAFGPGLQTETATRGAQPRWGGLKVVTTNMLPGWLSRNGVPYGQNMTLTEHFTRFHHDVAGDWFVVTQVIEDPQYLNGQWITSLNFKKEPNDAKWSPAPCKP
jgi:hypothetical protein